jgi:hypothetical protein
LSVSSVHGYPRSHDEKCNVQKVSIAPSTTGMSADFKRLAMSSPIAPLYVSDILILLADKIRLPNDKFFNCIVGRTARTWGKVVPTLSEAHPRGIEKCFKLTVLSVHGLSFRR